MKFYVCQKKETEKYVILTGIKYVKENDNEYKPQVHTRFFNKDEYNSLLLDESFPFVIEFKTSVNIPNGKN